MVTFKKNTPLPNSIPKTGINLTKSVKELHFENYKKLVRETEEGTYGIHGLGDSTKTVRTSILPRLSL